MFSIIKALTLNDDELSQYYLAKRRHYYKKKGTVPQFIKLHNILHYIPIPVPLFCKITRIIKGIKLSVLCDERIKSKEPIIYACTHVGGIDIETAFETIITPCWLFLGDPREVYRNIDGLMLGLNGVICVELNDKTDRKIAKETAVGLLQNGGNLMIFPEGAWNISVNKLVMSMFPGTAEIAIKSKAQIVPVAIECYGKHMYVAIGKNIKTNGIWEDKYELTKYLRDALATLKWQIFEAVGCERRRNIPKNYRQIYINNIINKNKVTSYTEKDVIDTMFIDKNIVEYSDAFSHLNNVTINHNTAFLFNKRLK